MDMRIYCLKCKIKTDTSNITKTRTNNNRNLIRGTCSNCGNKKSVFVSAQNPATVQGSGFSLNSFINNLPVELHQFAEKGENVPGGSFNDQQKYSFCGPGTRYEQRIREGYKGINELDKMCKLHDQFYNENKDTKERNISDIALARRADEIANNLNYDEAQRRDAKFISGIMKTKAYLGFGLNDKKSSKNGKRRPGAKN
jgi:hypothetical protein